ncbi:MBL fold metallo-hydrolase [Aquibacillus halophilus]|uniref:MBL fold metallo-hydrolase n=2 Tax=Aquibacillus halophilus TaxID=930132 RepID=A0A6A8DGG8_9BACI|nr:MBL fold metallo-hydrolase [Aquibacillus halophilus]MRH44754.1 MBL fold metallo-hydrolase [Aquibacillus halophilus]
MGLNVAPDIYCYTDQIVNLVFIGTKDSFVLVDAGMPRSSTEIIQQAEDHFGNNASPKAIILTHGHFDHVGSIIDLVKTWDVPVFAHDLELPYLTGKASYPEGDPSVDGGLVAKMSPFFPNHGINLENHVQPLPKDGTIPGMDGWRWIHTPGHTKGHVSLFRDADRSLIVGDAFVTVKQESLYKVITQQQEISGPPKYFTTNWDAAWNSVKELNKLEPEIAVTGHGHPMEGVFLREELQKLADHFDTIAIPEKGKFVH